MKRLALGIAGCLVAFAATTWWALESSNVAIAETVRPDGSVRRTHVWFARDDGELLLEAGTPSNGWYQDILQNPTLTLVIEGSKGRFLAEPLPETMQHAHIRGLIRRKYGFRDQWVGILVDTSESVAVRLTPAAKR